jgi:ABC-2 type transport system ATP-binding protein
MDEAEYCDRIGLIYRGELIALGAPERLKTEWMREEVLECLCERPQEAMEVLGAVPGVREAALFGKGIHLMVDEAEQAGERIRQVLTDNGFQVFRVGKIVPSLEDVFVSLIETKDRAEQPQQEVWK